jgi:hypothetical protein
MCKVEIMPKVLNISNQDFTFLENNTKQLGKFIRKGFCYQKKFLSYNDKGQWQLLTLGLLDILRRNIFGYYKETHLKHIAREWNQLTLRDNFCPKIRERLAHLWSKTYPKESYPPFAYFLGNSSLKDAQVIGIGLLHTDPTNAYMTGKILSEYYRSGDVILVEGVDADVSLNAKQVPMTTLIDKPVTVHGWEPVGYTEVHRRIFAPTLALDTEFRLSVYQLKELCKNIPLSGEGKLWFEQLEKAIHHFNDILKKIENGEKENLSTYIEELQILYKRLLSSAFSPQEISNFIKGFNNVSECCLKFLEKKKYYSLWTPEATKFFQESWSVREESLCNEISNHLGDDKRVFICAGTARFFPNRGRSEAPVLKLLKTHKFTIGLANTGENDAYYSFEKLFKQFTVHDKASLKEQHH